MSDPLLPESHLQLVHSLEEAYLSHSDPIRQSGFGGGDERWRLERSPLLDAVDSDGDFLDVGCANGYLLECLVNWGHERGVSLIPHGLDLNPRLVLEALRRFPDLTDRFWVGNAWNWLPPRRFKWVYMLYDCIPENMVPDWCRHMLDEGLTDDGTLIIGAYGSVSADRAPLDIDGLLRSSGLRVSGESSGGTLPSGGPVTRFAWMRREEN